MSTGYVEKVEVHKQPSSSGQIIEMSSGSQRTYKDGSILQVSSGATLNNYGTVSNSSGAVVNVDDGATLRMRSNSIVLDQTYSIITAAATGGTIAQRGVCYIAPTSSETVYQMSAPQDGAMVRIVIAGASSVYLRIVSSSGCPIGGAGTSGPFCIVSDSNVRANTPAPGSILLQSTGSARYRVISIDSTADLAFSTALS